jgi:hypothetical protein
MKKYLIVIVVVAFIAAGSVFNTRLSIGKSNVAMEMMAMASGSDIGYCYMSIETAPTSSPKALRLCDSKTTKMHPEPCAGYTSATSGSNKRQCDL